MIHVNAVNQIRNHTTNDKKLILIHLLLSSTPLGKTWFRFHSLLLKQQTYLPRIISIQQRMKPWNMLRHGRSKSLATISFRSQSHHADEQMAPANSSTLYSCQISHTMYNFREWGLVATCCPGWAAKLPLINMFHIKPDKPRSNTDIVVGISTEDQSAKSKNNGDSKFI